MSETSALHLDEARLWLRGRAGEVVSGLPGLGTRTDGVLRWAPEVEAPPFEPSVLGFLDSGALAFDNTVVPVSEALTAVFVDAFAQCGGPGSEVMVTCPMHWGEPRVAVVRAALGSLVDAVEVHPAVLSPAAVRAARLGSISGRVRCLVVECTALTTTVGYVVYDHDGGRIHACEHAPSVGEADIRAERTAGAGGAVLRALLGRVQRQRVVDLLLVLGEVGDAMVEAIRVACRESISPLLDIRCVGGRRLVDVQPPVASTVVATVDDGVPLPTVATMRATEHRRRRQRVVAVMLIVAAAVVGVVALRWHYRSDGSEVGAHRVVTVGRLTFDIPAGWRVRPSIAGESPDVVRLVPVDGHRRRIELSQNGLRGNPTLDQVAADLQSQIRAAGGKYGPLQHETFGGRPVLTYPEIEEGNSEVTHHVIVMHGAQVTVDCQYLTGEWDAIAGACAHVVASAEVGP